MAGVNKRFPVLAARLDGAAPGSAVLVVFAGSSTTKGTGASDRGRTSYAALVSERLRQRYPMVRTENVGVGGTTAATYLPDEVCDRIAAQRPAAILHMVGSNDYARGVSPAAYGATLADRLGRVDAGLDAPCQHVLVHTFARPDITEPAAPWGEFREQLDRVVAGHPDRVVVDVDQAFVDLGVGYRLPDPRGLIGTDGKHLTDGGHAVMADLVWRALEGTETRV